MLCALQGWYVAHQTLADALFLALCAGAAALAWRLRQRPWATSLCLATSAAVAALACSTDDFLHRWDEQFHALVAKNLALHPLMPTLYEVPLLPASGYWDSTHVWLFHPPFPLWVMALSHAALGSCELALRVPSVLAHAAATVAVYFAGARLFRAQVGWWAALLYGLNGRLIELAGGRAGGDHPDSLFASLFTLAVALLVVQADTPKRWRPVLAGALVGCLVLTKWLTGFFALALFGFLIWRRKQLRARWLELALATLAALAVVVPWEAYALVHYPWSTPSSCRPTRRTWRRYSTRTWARPSFTWCAFPACTARRRGWACCGFSGRGRSRRRTPGRNCWGCGSWCPTCSGPSSTPRWRTT